MKVPEIKRGQPITFRIPADTPDYIVKHLQYLKETEKRNFSSKVAEFVIRGTSQSLAKHQEILSLPLPRRLNKAQRDWLKHEQSQALLGNIIHHLLSDPIRAASLLSALNNDIPDEGNYAIPFEEAVSLTDETQQAFVAFEEKAAEKLIEISNDDDLDDIDWETELEVESPVEEKQDESLDDLLGDFLNQMNK